MAAARARWPELAPYADELRAQWPLPLPGCHRLLLAEGRITLDLWFGDVNELLPQFDASMNNRSTPVPRRLRTGQKSRHVDRATVRRHGAFRPAGRQLRHLYRRRLRAPRLATGRVSGQPLQRLRPKREMLAGGLPADTQPTPHPAPGIGVRRRTTPPTSP